MISMLTWSHVFYVDLSQAFYADLVTGFLC